MEVTEQVTESPVIAQEGTQTVTVTETDYKLDALLAVNQEQVQVLNNIQVSLTITFVLLGLLVGVSLANIFARYFKS